MKMSVGYKTSNSKESRNLQETQGTKELLFRQLASEVLRNYKWHNLPLRRLRMVINFMDMFEGR